MSRSPEMLDTLRWVGPPLVIAVAFGVAWEVVARTSGVPAYLVPPPSGVARAAFAHAPLLIGAAWSTAVSALLGFTGSAIFGVSIAIVLASSRLVERALYPYALALQTVPVVAVAPLLVLWLGAGRPAIAGAAFIVSVFPVITSSLAGLRSVDPALRDLFRLYRASPLATLTKLSLPHATHQIATGLRVACALAVIGAIVGELVAGFAEGSGGLGIVIMSAYRQLRTDLLFAAVGCSALVGLALFGAVARVSHLMLRRWHPSAR